MGINVLSDKKNVTYVSWQAAGTGSSSSIGIELTTKLNDVLYLFLLNSVCNQVFTYFNTDSVIIKTN